MNGLQKINDYQEQHLNAYVNQFQIITVKSQRMMVFFFCFSTKNYFLNLFARIRIETHFPLLSSLFNYFAVVMCIMNNRK